MPDLAAAWTRAKMLPGAVQKEPQYGRGLFSSQVGSNAQERRASAETSALDAFSS